MMEFIKKEKAKKLIYRDTDKINKTNKELIDIIGIINKYTERLNNLGIKLDVDDVKSLLAIKSEFINRVYLQELRKICEQFCVNYDDVSSVNYKIRAGNPMFSNMANNRINFLFELKKELYDALHYDSICIKHLEINDNIAAPKITATEDIEKENTFYCQNKKQEDITNELNKVQDAMYYLHNKYNIPYSRLYNYIEQLTNKLYYNAIQGIK